jgi:beta-xylosidase
MQNRYAITLFTAVISFFIFCRPTQAATVAVHDPSVVIVYKDAAGNSYPENDVAGTRTKFYYIFGTQLGAAYSRDMLNWTPFTPTFSVNGSLSTNYYNVFKVNADWSKHTTSENVRGNLWAPDIIYNKAMKKWCLYFSINGDDWLSSIALHTADKIEGPYTYAGTVVYSGMDRQSTGTGNADYQKVTGSSTVANRYLTSAGAWKGEYGSSCIDPNVLYDESGKLWLVYGSWSGGIFVIKLDEQTGLRNYTHNYGFTNFLADGAVWNGTTLRYDPYMGVHIAGGYYVSGEGAYVKYFKDPNGVGYYYLFVTMGFYSPEGGYTMRVFRSTTLDGEYRDVTGDNAAFSRYIFNYGNNVQYGMPLMQNFKYSWWNIGQVAQGHNSLLRDEDGSAYLVYHTKYDNGTIHHNVEVHQLFFNERGWPLAAPFEYRKGFGLGTKTYTAEDIAGRYNVIAHKAVDYATLKSNLEQQVYLNADGSITGAYTGTWTYNYSNGRQFITLTTSAGTFQSVLCEQLMDGLSTMTLSFTGMNAANEQCLYGYRTTATATTTTTHYRGSSLLVGDRNYTLAFDAYDKFHNSTVSGDFEVEYTFVNNTLAAENWHNWAVGFRTASETWHMRADAFSNSTFTGSTVGYWYNWDWAAFKPVFQNKEVRVKVSRIGTTINVFAFVGNQLVYTASAINSPTGNLTVYLGGETCYLDVKKVSVSQLGTRQKVGTANDDGTYPAPFNTQLGPTTSVTGDFELNYHFNNYRNALSTDNWDNYLLRVINGSTTMLLRADAFAMTPFGTLAYTYDWDWANFLAILSGANIELKISRKGTVITYTSVITARNGQKYNYQVVQTQAPTGALSFGFTCEESFLDFFEVEKTSYLGTDVVTSNAGQELLNQANVQVYAADQVLYIRATEAGQASIVSVDGKSISKVSYTAGMTTVYGLQPGMYVVNGMKVLIR